MSSSSSLSQNLAFVILSPSLTSRPDFLAGKIACAFKDTAFGELTADSIVHAVLEAINVLIACDLGFAEVVWIVVR